MSEYKLHYFNIRGKGELIRLIFAAAGEEYEDIRYKARNAEMGLLEGLTWDDEAKASMPLGQMPVLEVGGVKYCQQLSIAKFLARRFGLMGDELQALKVDMLVDTMWLDVAMKCILMFFEKDEEKKAVIKEKANQDIPAMLKNVAKWVEGGFVLGDKLSLADIAIFDTMVIVEFFLKDLEVPPEIQTVRKNVAEDEKIKHWVNSRPVTNL